MVVTSVENKTPPTKIEPVPVVVRNVQPQETNEQPSNYHHDIDGDLHKLINKKSEYLKDMLDFDPNK